MRTIKQNVEVDFNSITIQDAIILIPLMDKLIDDINYARVANHYEYKDKRLPSKYMNRDLFLEEMEAIYKILSTLGFCGSGKIDLLPDGYPLKDRN